MVEYYESVVNLKISHNKNLGIRAWLAAARMIRKVLVSIGLCHTWSATALICTY